MTKSKDRSLEVYEVVEQISPGKVSTYGDLAKWLNFKTPRQIG
jgi:alkylated DNA nucleotide flippase Atl1